MTEYKELHQFSCWNYILAHFIWTDFKLDSKSYIILTRFLVLVLFKPKGTHEGSPKLTDSDKARGKKFDSPFTLCNVAVIDQRTRALIELHSWHRCVVHLELYCLYSNDLFYIKFSSRKVIDWSKWIFFWCTEYTSNIFYSIICISRQDYQNYI